MGAGVGQSKRLNAFGGKSEEVRSELEDGRYKIETLVSGVLHSLKEPAKTVYFADGSVRIQMFYRKGVPHRVRGVAAVEYREDGSLFKEGYFLHGQQHRLGGPALIYYRESGEVAEEQWLVKDKRHREDGPAQTMYTHDADGQSRPFIESWYRRGGKHREDGPAHIQYDENGDIAYVEYWLDGKQVSRSLVDASAAARLSQDQLASVSF